jgi:ferredoxin
MEAFVDQDACIGCGLCPAISPEVFDMADDGKAHVIVDTVPEGAEDSAVEAQESCPVDAIKVEG